MNSIIEIETFADPTDKGKGKGINDLKGFEGFYGLKRVIGNEKHTYWNSWDIIQYRRVDSDNKRVDSYMKRRVCFSIRPHHNYIRLEDANLKTVWVRVSDLIKHYESVNGKVEYNHYEHCLTYYTSGKSGFGASHLESLIESLKRDYNTDGTHKQNAETELEIIIEEKLLGRKLTVKEEMKVDDKVYSRLNQEKYAATRKEGADAKAVADAKWSERQTRWMAYQEAKNNAEMYGEKEPVWVEDD